MTHDTITQETALPAASEMDCLVSTFERQLALLLELENELVACRAAFTGMDIDKIYGHLAKQAMLCEKLREAKAENAIAWHAASQLVRIPAENMDLPSLINTLEPALARRLREILTKLALAEGNVRHLNHVHRVYIEGSNRTLNILSNALASISPTYNAALRPRRKS